MRSCITYTLFLEEHSSSPDRDWHTINCSAGPNWPGSSFDETQSQTPQHDRLNNIRCDCTDHEWFRHFQTRVINYSWFLQSKWHKKIVCTLVCLRICFSNRQGAHDSYSMSCSYSLFSWVRLGVMAGAGCIVAVIGMSKLTPLLAMMPTSWKVFPKTGAVSE